MGKFKQKKSSKIKFLKLRFLFIILLVLNSYNLQSAENELENLTFNFNNADLDVVVKNISEILKKPIIVDPKIKGKITLISSGSIKKENVYSFVVDLLRVQGFALIKASDYYLLVKDSNINSFSSFTENEPKLQKDKGNLDVETRIFEIKHELSKDLVSTLKPLVTKNQLIVSNDSNNTIIITDYSKNLDKLQKIIKILDSPGKFIFKTFNIKNSSASKIAQVINKLFVKNNNNIEIFVENTNNLIIVKANNPKTFEDIEKLILEFDLPYENNSNIHLVHLKNANAVELSKLLRGILEFNNSNNSSNSNKNNTQQINIKSNIQADEKTNTLIIKASQNEFKELKIIIDRLDSRRAQVFVESLIVEVSADKAESFGIQWAGVAGSNSSDFRIGLLAGVADANIAQSGSAILSLSDSNNSVEGMSALAIALENNAGANILSMPNILTLDNEEAKIIVGKNVPLITGQYSAVNNSNVNPFQTIERQDVGLSLKLKPQISESGSVKLEIYQETSSIQESTSSGVITNKRAIETNVLVNDGDIVVLGGLMEDTLNDSLQKVPLLGDIPILGKLFQFKTKQRVKTNLLVFLRPTVLRTSFESNTFSIDRYNEIGAQNNDMSIDEEIVIPPLGDQINESKTIDFRN
jgi:general secretion pathway protein D